MSVSRLPIQFRKHLQSKQQPLRGQIFKIFGKGGEPYMGGLENHGSTVKYLFSVCPVISLFFCLAVNSCIGNILDFCEFLHVARGFLKQSDCRTFENSMLMKQAILNTYLNTIMWLDILRANEFIKYFCLVMVSIPNFVSINQIPRSLKFQ